MSVRTFDMQAISAQDIVDTVREGLVVLDSDLTVATANRRFFDMFDVPSAETIGKRIYDLGNGQWDIPDLRRLLEEVLPREQAVDAFEVDHDFPHLGHMTILLSARRVFHADNQAEHILVTFYDITENREHQRAAARAAQITREIVDTIRDPLVILDADLTITTASRSFLRMFGGLETDLIGKSLQDLEQGQWDIPALRNLLKRVVPDNAPFDDYFVEDSFPGLGQRAFKLNARKIYVPGNHVTHLMLVFEDVTEAVAADRHKDMLAAELAHRIKNSLTVISAFVAFEMRRAAEPCLDGYRAMQTRINAVAELYDLIAKSSALGPVDVPTYFAGIAGSIESSLLGNESGIEIAVEAQHLMIHADHAVPVGLLINELATNAVKYAFPNNKGRITLGVRRRDGEVTLFVADNGVGLEKGIIRAGASSGLGSRFIDAFTQQIGGTLARASGSTGTTVTIRLPSYILA